MAEEIINRVASSALVQIDLEHYYPKEEIVEFDIKPYLFMELILKEKDFRRALQEHTWESYRDKVVAVTCSTDAIIPVWAYMLIASYLQPYAKDIVAGTKEVALRQAFLRNVASINAEEYRDQRVVVKGCGDLPVGEFVYLEITKLLQPLAKSIMYGEPCSTVPVYKRK